MPKPSRKRPEKRRRIFEAAAVETKKAAADHGRKQAGEQFIAVCGIVSPETKKLLQEHIRAAGPKAFKATAFFNERSKIAERAVEEFRKKLNDPRIVAPAEKKHFLGEFVIRALLEKRRLKAVMERAVTQNKKKLLEKREKIGQEVFEEAMAEIEKTKAEILAEYAVADALQREAGFELRRNF